FSKTTSGTRLFFPYNAIFRNIKVTGRQKGARLIRIPQPNHYHLSDEGSYDGVRLHPNATIIFDNIQLDQLPAGAPDAVKNVHFQLGDGTERDYDDANSLYPKIYFSHCENICAYMQSGIAEVY